MKKFLIALMLLGLMCLCGAAQADGHPCDVCGGSTSLVGTGNWCHWYCSECDYTTSRNHDPNSYYSGLVPDSCSGLCQWCGRGANFSAHSFTTYVSDGNAGCVTDGTETASCANQGCTATHNRTAVGSALGHDNERSHVPAACQEEGYTLFTCKRCGNQDKGEFTPPAGHSYGQWSHNGDGTHTAHCTRRDCTRVHTAACSEMTVVAGGRKMTLCPVCGRITGEDGSTVDMDTSENVTARALTGSLAGKPMVLVDPAPIEVPLETEAFYMFILSFQRNGVTAAPNGTTAVAIDLNEHPFQMESRVFANATPADLNSRAFKVVRVEQETVDGMDKEVWVEVPFTMEEGVLTFETDKSGVFLMVLMITYAPEM